MKGHKDKSGTFHPHTQYIKSPRKSRDQDSKLQGVKTDSGIRKARESDSSLQKMFEFEKTRVSKQVEDSEYGHFNSILLNDVTNWGFGDIGEAIDKARSVNISASELAKLVEEFHEDTETEYEDIDVVAVIYEHILQSARGKIDEVIKYDFLNDFSGDGTEFYVAGNYMATTYDYSQSAVDELKEKVKMATKEQQQELSKDVFVRSFFDDVDLFR